MWRSFIVRTRGLPGEGLSPSRPVGRIPGGSGVFRLAFAVRGVAWHEVTGG